MKIVINTCYGAFDLSYSAKRKYISLSGVESPDWGALPRNDKHLVRAVEELGDLASGDSAQLEVVEVEGGKWYKINNTDGLETIEYKDMSGGWQLAIDD